jgi:hypothetical protein
VDDDRPWIAADGRIHRMHRGGVERTTQDAFAGARGTGPPLGEIAMTAVHASDNTAMNLMLKEVGGTAGLDKIHLGYCDTVTHVVDH